MRSLWDLPSPARWLLSLLASTSMAACVARPDNAAQDSTTPSASTVARNTPDTSTPPPPPKPSYAYAEDDVRFMPLPFTGWHVAGATDSLMFGDSVPRDLGHGVVYIRLDWQSGRSYPQVDTFLIRQRPDSSSDAVGAIVTNRRAEGWPLFMNVWAPRPVTDNVREFGYEEIGMPFDSIDATARWHRIIMGFTSERQPWTGWVAVGDSIFERATWKEKFMGNSLYFINFDSGSFHSAPNGPVVTTTRALADSGFDVTSIDSQWPWMKVEVEHPGETCEGNYPPHRRTDTLWLRALDERGRPRVFYPTRGC